MKIIYIVNNTVNRKIFAIKFFFCRQPFPTKIKHAKYLCNIHQPIYLFWSLKSDDENLDYVKNLQAKDFTGENIPIYGIILKIFVY